MVLLLKRKIRARLLLHISVSSGAKTQGSNKQSRSGSPGGSPTSGPAAGLCECSSGSSVGTAFILSPCNFIILTKPTGPRNEVCVSGERGHKMYCQAHPGGFN